MEFTSIEALREDIAKIIEQINHLEKTKGVLEQALALLTQTEHAGASNMAIGEMAKEPVPHPDWDVPAQPTPEVEKAKETAAEIDEELNNIREGLDALSSPEKPKQRGGRGNKITTNMVRDAVLELRDHTFTALELAEKIGASRTGILPKLQELVRREIVVDTGERRPARAGKGSILYRYNENIPAGPTERPRVTPPEKELIGATPPRGRPMGTSNGQIYVSDSMIQGFINCAYQQGWTVEWKDSRGQGGSHLKFKSPAGVTVGVNAKPANRKVGLVIKRDLKRAGLRLA